MGRRIAERPDEGDEGGASAEASVRRLQDADVLGPTATDGRERPSSGWRSECCAPCSQSVSWIFFSHK